MITEERRRELEVEFYNIIIGRIETANCDFGDFDGIELDEDNMEEEVEYIFSLSSYEILEKYDDYYVYAEDDDGHGFIIPEKMKKNFSEKIENNDDIDEFEEYAIDGGIYSYKFQNPKRL
ncbi:MAG: hypothetical protein M0R03_03800 [Novosphingobium sp.]|nr:hypothetical protein [Novosphingobium sp.]